LLIISQNLFVLNGDVTKFVFAFDTMRIFDNFTAFNIRRIVGGISGEYEYFILFNLIKLY